MTGFFEGTRENILHIFQALVRKGELQNGLNEKFVELLLKLDYFGTMQYDVVHTSNAQTSKNDGCLLEVHRLSFDEFFKMFFFFKCKD